MQVKTVQLILGYSIRLVEQYFFSRMLSLQKVNKQSKNYFKSKIVSIVLLMFFLGKRFGTILYSILTQLERFIS